MQTEKKTWQKVLGVVGNILLWAFLIFSMTITIMVFSAQNSPDGIPSIFGKSLLTVATDSMKPVFNSGDLIIMEKLDQDAVSQLEVGDIVTYRSPIDLDGDGRTGDINTHRIFEKNAEDEEFITKGDNNPIADNQGDNAHTVSYHAVVGRYTGARVPGLGKVLAFLRTSLGFFLCVVLPLILFFLYELYVFISVVVSEKMKKKEAAEPQIDEEEIKRKAIEEYLAQQAAAKAAEAPAEEVKETPAEEAQEEAPAEEVKAEEAQEEAPTEEVKAEETQEEAPAEEAKAEQAQEEEPAEDSAEKPEETTAAEDETQETAKNPETQETSENEQ